MKNTKSYLISGLLVAIVVMTIGYAALSANLKINGTTQIVGDWNVRISEIRLAGTTGTAAEVSEPSINAAGDNASFNIKLLSPGDSITYEIVVQNYGTLQAYLAALNITPDAAVAATSGIKYTVTGVTAGVQGVGTQLVPDVGNIITIKAEWVSTDTTIPTEKTQTLTVDLDYLQDTSV